MLKPINEIKTITYDAEDGFLVDVTRRGNDVEAYIYHTDYAIKSLVFGWTLGGLVSPEYIDFLTQVSARLDEEKELYSELYMN